ncbi:hypothetical protein SETIT_3G174500v2 [Setaria italica]|uniref:Secreted protein n=1 Tax=Setaria italica TaxID=4555 RepID=A0A368QGM3_SETIT|nr:hypothetical protein SETIT_3G174500v2 [Setaria italica]
MCRLCRQLGIGAAWPPIWMSLGRMCCCVPLALHINQGIMISKKRNTAGGLCICHVFRVLYKKITTII